MREMTSSAFLAEAKPALLSLSAPLLAVRDVHYAIKGRKLVDGVTLSVNPARRMMIMGANGAGKSLLLRLMHGLITPTAGDILSNGMALDKRARKRQAMVFQRPVLLRRSVLANLRFALKVCGIAGAERARREAEAIERAELGHLLSRPARVLSGGEQQRLAIARALACKPDLLFLDEPTASLDPSATHAVECMINQAHEEGVAIVMVTHDLGQARRLGDDVAFLHAGRLAEFGRASAVLTQPDCEPVKAWLEGRLFIQPTSQT